MVTVWDTSRREPSLLAHWPCIAAAQRRLEELHWRWHLREFVIERLHADRELREPVRDAALRLAERYVDYPDQLETACWQAIWAPTHDAEQVRLAVAWGEAAGRLAPDDWVILGTLGVAQYRAQQYETTLDTLRRSDQIALETRGRASWRNAVCMAMALHKLGRTEEARAELDRAYELLGSDRSELRGAGRAFLLEAERLIPGAEGEAAPASQPAQAQAAPSPPTAKRTIVPPSKGP
jgi:tetratricopeptide (TPR) repeat protein